MKIRPERVGHMIQREVADLIANRLRDPGLGSWVSVTGVDVTGDLSFARIEDLIRKLHRGEPIEDEPGEDA